MLGEAPSAAGDRYNGFPLSGAPARTICGIMGWPTDGPAYWTLVEHFETLNAIERHEDAYPWREERARRRWWDWRQENGGPLVVVALGRRASSALGLGSIHPWGEWRTYLEGDHLTYATVAPHTSGRSRIMNNPDTRDLLGRILTEAITRARGL